MTISSETTRLWPLLSPQYTLSPGDHQAVASPLPPVHPQPWRPPGCGLSSPPSTPSALETTRLWPLLSPQYTLSPGDHQAVASPLPPVHPQPWRPPGCALSSPPSTPSALETTRLCPLLSPQYTLSPGDHPAVPSPLPPPPAASMLTASFRIILQELRV
ncbi:unnamed protein product [Arctogadus glacialis]